MYSLIYPDAPMFVELADQLFRVPASYKCICCDERTEFVDYTFEGIPIPTCSGDCFQDFRCLYQYIKDRVPGAKM